MKTTLTLILTTVISLYFGQTSKTLKDTIFKKGDIIKIPTIIYTLSKPCCADSQRDSIKPVALFLNAHKDLKVVIAASTDSRGTYDKNLLLSTARAKSVWESLVFDFKVDSNSVKYKGYGESKLIISDTKILNVKTKEQKEELHRINRRTELIVIESK